MRGSLPLRRFRHDPRFLLAQFGREGLAEIVGLEDRADLDLSLRNAWNGLRCIQSIASPTDPTCHSQ